MYADAYLLAVPLARVDDAIWEADHSLCCASRRTDCQYAETLVRDLFCPCLMVDLRPVIPGAESMIRHVADVIRGAPTA